MNYLPSIHSCRRPRGFALPTVIIVIAALMIMAVGSMLITGIERSSARSFVDQRRAEMATTISIEELRGIFKTYAENDDFYIVSREFNREEEEEANDSQFRIDDVKRVPYLFIAKGSPSSGGGDAYEYKLTPLFGAEMAAVTQQELKPPLAENFLNLRTEKNVAKLTTLPWMDPVKVNWRYVTDPANPGQVISRYAYFVEDMQGKINPEVAGRLPLMADGSMRSRWPNPNYKPLDLDSKLPAQSVIGLFTLDPEKSRIETNDLSTSLIRNRNYMLTPESPLGASGLNSEGAGNQRNAGTGILENAQAAAIEMNTIAKTQPYDERPVLPFAPGIEPGRAGQVKINLNQLLNQPDRSGAVASFANQIRNSLIDPPGPFVPFEDRKGGLPPTVDYLSTLAANAFDYADADSAPTIGGNYLGLDGFPLLSEIYLHIHYQGAKKIDTRHVHQFRFQLFIELWNMTNLPVQGSAETTYEVNMALDVDSKLDEVIPFDDPRFLDDPTQSSHSLIKKDGSYKTASVSVSLLPDEYKVLKMAEVNYTIDFFPRQGELGKNFTFNYTEEENQLRGISLYWNNDFIQRVPAIVRRPQNLTSDKPIFFARAAIPGHSYGIRQTGSTQSILYVNNMGDPRISSYLEFGLNPRRGMPLSDNIYRNISPGRRNIRRATIYDIDPSNQKRGPHGRVLPSEWPDGGHDSPVGNFPVLSTEFSPTLPTDPMFNSSLPVPDARNAPHRLSNEGVFYSTTELGLVYDPILWRPTYADLPGQQGTGRSDTAEIERSPPLFPPRRNVWPSVERTNTISNMHGGGNTLRIGRPEHPKFDAPGAHAASLLDLFHVGKPTSNGAIERQGNLARIEGQVNINTATRDAIRALAAGRLRQDEQIRRVTSWTHETSDGSFSARKASVDPPLSAPTSAASSGNTLEADMLADYIIAKRPFASAAELASVKINSEDANVNLRDQPVFGNKNLYPANQNNNRLQMTDAAAEEIFARVYEGSTLRSRNFRVWVVGQSISGTMDRSGNVPSVEVLAEARRAYSVFLDPGVRSSFGEIQNSQLKIIHERDF
ncbi:MAG: hypothetical protein EAZ42_07975 [Verrucomicrobia bacterium]|nr:MAG: hypothetical protein EAZ42_07975 [Verrucomicrobiota bacterium]